MMSELGRLTQLGCRGMSPYEQWREPCVVRQASSVTKVLLGSRYCLFGDPLTESYGGEVGWVRDHQVERQREECVNSAHCSLQCE